MAAIVSEISTDGPSVEALLDLSFGPGRHRKTCQRLREGNVPAWGLALAAREGEHLVGTLRFWNVEAGGVSMLLLGPMAVDPGFRSAGIGGRLIREGLDRATRFGHAAVILVGDPEYYDRFGFTRERTLNLDLPGPFEPRRFLGLELKPGALAAASGLVDIPAFERIAA